ncbi:alpha/beta fold hydrolase [Acetobacter musti]|uniref:Alpha/beta fold hydrolase n=1 Tax=Acetobacter musti TaxID=864732 RepID=A0ABX0JKV3_9PROT|nr:alpha/beta fold hydrolase [Acetobacter musti]NHN83996.1 alpha/beta fold hydrolase [Acetobacter musti]
MKLKHLAVLISGILSAPALALDMPPVKDGTVTLDHYRLEDGETLAPVRLHYLTTGTPQRDRTGQITNAVLILHGTVGTAHEPLSPTGLAGLFAPGKPLDTRYFYIVAPDGLGAGESSRPSDGQCDAFPHYGYLDRLALDRDMLARIGIVHEKLVLGTSMGGMQVWQWAERYPTDSDALVAVSSSPAAVSGRNMLWRQMIMEAITHDPDWHDGHPDPAHPPRLWLYTASPLFALMTSDAQRLQSAIPDRKDAAPFENTAIEKQARALNACDILRQFQSSDDYDPRPGSDRITAPFLSVNFADDMLNPPELLHLPPQTNVHELMIRDPAQLYGHMTMMHTEVWEAGLKAFLRTVPGWPTD